MNQRLHGRTPLAYAIKNGNRDVVQLLLDNGCDPIAGFDLAPEELQALLEDYRVCAPQEYSPGHAN